MNKSLWVPGWSLQLLLFVAAGVALWIGHADLSAIYATGGMVISVIRQIEKDRRAAEGPARDTTVNK